MASLTVCRKATDIPTLGVHQNTICINNLVSVTKLRVIGHLVSVTTLHVFNHLASVAKPQVFYYMVSDANILEIAYQLSPLLECHPTVCLSSKSYVNLGQALG